MASNEEEWQNGRIRNVRATGIVANALLKALHGKLSPRELAMIGFSDETQQAIKRAIELDPALEPAILNIADLCYRDGMDAQ